MALCNTNQDHSMHFSNEIWLLSVSVAIETVDKEQKVGYPGNKRRGCHQMCTTFCSHSLSRSFYNCLCCQSWDTVLQTIGTTISPISRPSPVPVFDCLQVACIYKRSKPEAGEGQGHRNQNWTGQARWLVKWMSKFAVLRRRACSPGGRLPLRCPFHRLHDSTCFKEI